jgi:hypothetical protein
MVNWDGSLRILIGMAEAVVLEGLSRVCLAISGEGVVPRPAGVEMLSGNIKSSRFMASRCSAVAA